MAINLPIVSTFDPKGINQAKGAFGKLGATVKNLAIAGAVTAATAAVGGLSTALTKGFGRLRDIENARMLLKGVGNDAETIEVVMTNALAAVKGTAFGLGEAAKVAAGAVAAGVKPGEELEKVLRVVADAAAVANVPMSEMGQIFNKVQTANRAYTMELNQLADRGIPIYQFLAEEAGVSAAAVRDMAADGEISAQMFRDAIEKNISGTALLMGETVQGSFANVQAALGRLGAAFLDPTFQQIPSFFQGLIASIDMFAEDFAASGTRFGDAVQPVGQAFMDALIPIVDALVPLIDIFSLLIEYLLPPFIELIGFGAGIIAELADALVPVIEAIMPVFIELLESLLVPLLPLVDAVMPLLVELIETLAPLVVTLIEAFLPLIELVMPILVEILQGLVIPLLEWMVELFGTHLVEAVNAFADFMAQHSPFIAQVVGAIGIAFTQVGSVIFSVINFALASIETLGNGIVAFFNNLIGKINDVRKVAGQKPLQLFSEIKLGRLAMPEFGDLAKGLMGIEIPAKPGLLPSPTQRELLPSPTFGGQWTYDPFTGRPSFVPGLAKGGIVTGPTLAMIGEAGPEAVIPLSKAAGMGATYNITVQAGVGDPVSIGREVVTAIKRFERANGPVFASA